MNLYYNIKISEEKITIDKSISVVLKTHLRETLKTMNEMFKNTQNLIRVIKVFNEFKEGKVPYSCLNPDYVNHLS